MTSPGSTSVTTTGRALRSVAGARKAVRVKVSFVPTLGLGEDTAFVSVTQDGVSVTVFELAPSGGCVTDHEAVLSTGEHVLTVTLIVSVAEVMSTERKPTYQVTVWPLTTTQWDKVTVQVGTDEEAYVRPAGRVSVTVMGPTPSTPGVGTKVALSVKLSGSPPTGVLLGVDLVRLTLLTPCPEAGATPDSTAPPTVPVATIERPTSITIAARFARPRRSRWPGE